MKKSLLAAAVVAGIYSTGAQSVVVNADGTGQVLIYPYYSVRGGVDTLFSVVNTHDEVKAVKVRFLEGKNSREVLDFNLYLSPFDVWTGAVVATEDGAMLISGDTSCTVPAIPAEGVPFRTFEFTGDRLDGAGTTPDRTREGYLEIIEMGVVFDEDPNDDDAFNPASDATHTSAGVPADCGTLVSAWDGGIWSRNPSTQMSGPTGGLFGGGILINVPRGVDVSYNATALAGFRVEGGPIHFAPGFTLPSLAQADPISFVTFPDGRSVRRTDWESGIDAVSAVLMHQSLMNEYLIDPALNAGTDWVITFPTKAFYVQRTFERVVDDLDARRPFTAVFGGTGNDPHDRGACEAVDLIPYDREEQTVAGGGIDFSPLPPDAEGSVLCWETNVVTFNDSNVLGSSLSENIDLDFTSGWLEMLFTGPRMTLGIDEDQFGTFPTNDGDDTDAVSGSDVFFGLPSVGFAVYDFVNGDVDGLLANYGNLFNHRATRSFITDVLSDPTAVSTAN